MAQCFPPTPPEPTPAPIRRIGDRLADLPSDCYLYWRPAIGPHRPSLAVLLPGPAVWLFPVYPWRATELLRIDGPDVWIIGRHGPTRVPHPKVLASRYWEALQRDLRYLAGSPIALQDGGIRSLLPRLPRAVWASGGDVWPTADGPQRRLRFADELPDPLAASSPQALLETLIGRSIDGDPPAAPPSRKAEAIHACLNPLATVTEAVDETDHDLDLALATLRQERQAASLGSGHRIVYGVTGSGKTRLVIARARYLGDRDPEGRYLVVCFNASAAALLRGELATQPNVAVHHFDAWARTNHVVRRAGEPNEALGERLKTRLATGAGDAGGIDGVLIDEAQDFPPSWFQCLRLALADPEAGDWLIVGDGCQGLYHRDERIVWSALGIKARGRTAMQRLQLDRNYRNTPEILRLAADVIDDAASASHLGVPARPEQARRGPGPRPVWLRRHRQAGEDVAVLGWIRRLLAGDTSRWGWRKPLRPEEIGILYARRDPARGRDPNHLAAQIGTLAPVIWLNAEPRARHRIAEPGIKLQTIHSAKGLEYRVVILIWADQLAPARQNPDDEARRLLYVGLTRAREGLVISSCGGSRLLATWRRRGWLSR